MTTMTPMTPDELAEKLDELTETAATAKRRANFALEYLARVIDAIDDKEELARIRREIG